MTFVHKQLEVVRLAPKRSAHQLPFGVWMALAKATPLQSDFVNETDPQFGFGSIKEYPDSYKILLHSTP